VTTTKPNQTKPNQRKPNQRKPKQPDSSQRNRQGGNATGRVCAWAKAMVCNKNNADLLMFTLARFFSEKAHIDVLKDVIAGNHKLSLRLIDWFVTNYARTHNVMLPTAAAAASGGSNKEALFNVHVAYRSQLKAYSKQLFDPFRRRNRISFICKEGTAIETTVGQLNFFRWAIQNGVLAYIEQHIRTIEADMSAGHSAMSPSMQGVLDARCTSETDHNMQSSSSGGGGELGDEDASSTDKPPHVAEDEDAAAAAELGTVGGAGGSAAAAAAGHGISQLFREHIVSFE